MARAVIAQIVFNLKMDAAIRAIESNKSLPNKFIEYPTIVAWFMAVGFLYSNINSFGSVVFLFV